MKSAVDHLARWGGRKHKTLTLWTQQLPRRAEVFVTEGEHALAAVFDDARLIQSVGLKAVVNVPLVNSEECCSRLSAYWGLQRNVVR
ncbi:MAG: hypothetical protein JWQ41_1738 [Variovorax sp.]|nr:hypothetical protein [Variovorax sp.]